MTAFSSLRPIMLFLHPRVCLIKFLKVLIIVIIDEYPYIAENAPELASLLQKEIDLQPFAELW